MDFKSFKEKALEQAKKLKEKTIEISDKTVNFTAKKLEKSNFTLVNKKQLDTFIKKSAKTSFKNKQNWEEKFYDHRVYVVFWDEKTDFFKNFILKFPVLAAKSFSQNVYIKLASFNIKDVNLKDYKVEKSPSMVVFENEKYLTTIDDKEKIQKLVKSLKLDINSMVNDFIWKK